MRISSELSQTLAQVVEASGLEFWGLEEGDYSVLRVYIESPDGITAEDCKRVSRQIGEILDVETGFDKAYRLEISSPGIERTLFNPKQYQRYIGSELKVLLREPILEQRNMIGVLTAVSDDEIVVDVDGEQQKISFQNIKKSKLRYKA